MDFGWTMFAALLGAALATFGSELIKLFFTKKQKHDAFIELFVDEIIKTIDSLKESGADFWGRDAKDIVEKSVILRSQIVGGQQYLSSCISEIFTGEMKKECDMKLLPFFNSLSGGDFDDPNRRCNLAELTAIHVSALQLRVCVLKCRRKQLNQWVVNKKYF